MNLLFILTSIGPYVLGVISLSCCLMLFFSVQRDNTRLRRKLGAMEDEWRRSRAEEEEAARARQASLAEMKASLTAAEERIALLTPSVPPRQGMTLNRRGQVLRMARRGEGPQQIAAALHIPLNEVQLLLKVHRAALRTA